MVVKNKEKERIMFNLEGETPSMPYIEIQIESEEALYKIKSVMGLISDFGKENWPNDDYFRENLPKWFIEEITKNNFEIIKRNPSLYLWDFGSWLDAMKVRNWKWFSTVKKNKVECIIIETNDFPYIIEPLEYLIRSSGLKSYLYFEHNGLGIIKQEWIRKTSGWEYNT